MLKALEFLNDFCDTDAKTNVNRVKYVLCTGETFIGTSIDIWFPNVQTFYPDSVNAFPMFFSDCGRSFLNSQDEYFIEIEDNKIPEIGSLHFAVEDALGRSIGDHQSVLNEEPLLCAEILGTTPMKVEYYRIIPNNYFNQFEVTTYAEST